MDKLSYIKYSKPTTTSPGQWLHRYFCEIESLKTFGVIFFSLFIASLLSILPLPEWARWCRPLWVCLVLVFWQVALPGSINLLTVWCCGIVLDVLLDTALGQHAIALLLVVPFVRLMCHKLKMVNVMQQALVIMPVFLVYQIMILLMQGMLGQMNHAQFFYLPAITTTLLWPWIVFLLMDVAKGLQREA